MIEAKGLATTELKLKLNVLNKLSNQQNKPYKMQKIILNCSRNAPTKLAEAEKALTEAKAKTAEAKSNS